MRSLILLSMLLLGLPGAALAADAVPGVTTTQVLQTRTTWDGQPIVYPAGTPEVTGILLEIAPGGEMPWHQHPVPSYGVVLEGELEVVLKDGRIKHLHAGEAVAEVVNTVHKGRNPGTRPAKMFVFYTGVVGQPLMQREP